MGRAQLRCDRGQTQAEYTLVVAAIAVACIVAALFVGGAVSGMFDSSSQPLVPDSGAFTPPVSPAQPTYPSSVEDCANGGWQSFPEFTSEEACVAYVHDQTP